MIKEFIKGVIWVFTGLEMKSVGTVAAFVFWVDGDKLRVMRSPKGSTCENENVIVCLCATEGGGMKVAVAIAEMLNGRNDL